MSAPDDNFNLRLELAAMWLFLGALCGPAAGGMMAVTIYTEALTRPPAEAAALVSSAWLLLAATALPVAAAMALAITVLRFWVRKPRGTAPLERSGGS